PNIHIPYAGLLSGTDLGAPVTGAAGTKAVWNGTLRAHTGLITNIDRALELTITFGAVDDVEGSLGKIEGAVRTFTTEGFELKGTYDASGVISGTVYHGAGFTNAGDARRLTGTDTNGILTGLFGAQGAVGVFLSGTGTKGDITAGVGSNYVGGFFVKPPSVVKHTAWVDSFSSAPPATRTAGTDTFGGFLNLADGVRDISPAGLTSPNADTHLTLDGDGDNGMHGVVYRAGRNGTNQQAFVAVLPTTNLGAPLTQASGTATWLGTYYNSSLVRDENNIPFLIDFGAKTITASRLVSLGNSNITTRFALNFTPATGVITGTVSEGSTPATARGLIGTKGLVGVYVDTRTGLPDGSGVVYGGFIADNPDN
ncbi:MAG: hypothetical protein K8953_08790, partial [Proteobacteria bacterium]|nr:hypothetical protein [Pseudomonadota bacterium]